MKNHPKSSRDKSRRGQDKKQAREIAASEHGSAAKPETVAPKDPAPKREDAAPKPKDLASKPKEVAPELKETAPQREDVAPKPKPVAPSAPAPQPVAMLELPPAPSKPSLASPQPALDGAAPTIEWSFEAAGQSALAVNRKLFEIAQANVTSSLDHARNLASAKSPVEMMRLQMAYWQECMGALASQTEELRALSAELVASASEPIKAHMRRTLAAPAA
jgi:hypothetical protein